MSKISSILQAIAWVSLPAALVVGTTGDQNAQIILASLAGLSIMAYVVSKQLGRGNPRFLAARSTLIVGLLVMAGGVAITLAGSVQNELLNSASAGVQLKIVGISLYLVGILGVIISLATSGTTGSPEWAKKATDTPTAYFRFFRAIGFRRAISTKRLH